MAISARRLLTLTVPGFVSAAILALAPAAEATNATNLLGYSSAQVGMGGAGSVGLLDNSLINTNPASLSLLPDGKDRDPQSSISGGYAGFTLGLLQPYLHHTDAFGNDREGENNPLIGIHGGAALRFRALPQWTFGLGLFSQSGVATEFKGLRTAFGTRDEITSFERFVKLQAAVSYQVTENLSIGAGPYLGYSDLTLQLFPNTSAPPVFAGLAIGDRCSRNFGLGEPGSDCPWTVVVGGKVGITYRVTPQLTVGAAYTSKADFDYEHGTAEVNFVNAGLGKVRYDVDVDGISHPQFVQAGIAYRPTPRWLLALDFYWHDWSSFKKFTIHLTNPKTPGAPANIDLVTQEDWRDQYVVAVGAAYELVKDVFTVRAGYNYANNPSPSRTFTPFIQLPFEHHVTAGAGYKFGGHFELDGSFLYAFENKVTYTNNQFPFGPNATEKPSGFSADVTLGYRF
jgi:long-chain fatty acid transport protein